ncbi:MAG: PDC sensor domain-containing protein [Bacillota bacterium]
MSKKRTTDNSSINRTIIVVFAAIIALSVLGFYLANRNTFSFNRSIKEELSKNVGLYADQLNERIHSAGSFAFTLAKEISLSDNHDESKLEQVVRTNMENHNMIIGSGYWFEPNMFKSGLKHYGPYYYKDENNKIHKNPNYGSESFNYFEFEWYRNGLDPNKELVYNPPARDELMETTFITCTSPIVKNGKTIGVSTADVSLSETKLVVITLKVGEEGYAYLLTKDGFYIANELRGMHDLEDKITDDENKEISSLGKKIITSDKPGIETLNSTGQYAAYSPIGDTGLYLVLVHPIK